MRQAGLTYRSCKRMHGEHGGRLLTLETVAHLPVQYVTECFANSSLFHKALKEAFESFCNKQVSGSSMAELMANFCDNLLKKVGAAPFAAPRMLHSLLVSGPCCSPASCFQAACPFSKGVAQCDSWEAMPSKLVVLCRGSA